MDPCQLQEGPQKPRFLRSFLTPNSIHLSYNLPLSLKDGIFKIPLFNVVLHDEFSEQRSLPLLKVTWTPKAKHRSAVDFVTILL